jgi:hypothetical protein
MMLNCAPVCPDSAKVRNKYCTGSSKVKVSVSSNEWSWPNPDEASLKISDGMISAPL